MQVSLVSKRGVPDDAIISIRSGAVRRQGAASTDKPFRFPQNASETDCVVKVDIMQNIGSGYLVMRPNQTDGKEYEVVLGGNSDMACALSVKPAEGAGPAAAESQEEAQAAAKTKQDAKAYLESTGLLTFVQGVLQVVAKQQPQDPFAAMAKHFLSASDEAASPAPGSPKVAPPSLKAPDAVPEASAPAPESPKAEPAEAEAAAGSPEGEAKAAPEADAQVEEAADKAEPDQVDDKKSDTLEEFTSTVKDVTLPAEGDAAAKEQDDTAAKEAEQPQENQAAPDAAGEAKEAAAAPEETPNDGAGAAAEGAVQEGAEGEGQAAQPDTAETGADDKKEEAAAETNEGAE